MRGIKKAAYMLLTILTMLGARSVLIAQVNLNEGLVAFYPLDGSSQDASGNGNNGVRSGGTSYVSDRFGVPARALSFGGVSNGGKMTVAHSPSLAFTNGATFSFWVRVASAVGTFGNGSTGSGGSQCFFAKEGDAGGGLWNNVFINNGNLATRLGNNSMSTLNGDFAPYALNQWIHYTVMMSATGHQVYINGVLIAENTVAANFAAMMNRPLVLGRFSSNWYPLNGALDDFRVYNRLLTLDEINALANAVQPALTLSGAPTETLCAGSEISLNFSADFTPAPANTYIAELSDADGSFASITASASLQSAAQTGSIDLTIPQSVISGANYRVRIRSTAPAATSNESEEFAVFSLFGGMADPNNPAGPDQSACVGADVELNAGTLNDALISWSGPNGFMAAGATATLSDVEYSDAANYTATYALNGCEAFDTVQVSVFPAPNLVGENAMLSSSLTTGMIAHLPLNGDGIDISGNNYNGVLLNGASAAADRFGSANGAVLLDGVNDYIDLADAVYFDGSPFTVSVWLNKQGNPSFSRYFDFGSGQQNNNVLAFITNGTNGRPGAQIYAGNAAQSTTVSPTVVPLNQWHLMTMTFENGTVRIFINGVQVASGPQNTPQNVIRNLCYIGRSNWPSDGFANGRFDDFRIYNRVLSNTEIQQLVMEQPQALAINASSNLVCIGSSVQITLANTQHGVNYSVIDADLGTAVAADQIGNGATLVFTVPEVLVSSNYQVHASTLFNACEVIAGSVNVEVFDEPAAPEVTSLTLCQDEAGVLLATGAPADALYRWYAVPVGGEILLESLTGEFETGPLSTSITYFVSILYANGCESERVPIAAMVINPIEPIDLDEGLIVYYTFDETLEDFSGNDYDATVFGSNSYVNDRNGVPLAALNTTASGGGGNNYLTAGNPAAVNALTNQVTFSFWIRQLQTWFGSDGFEGQMPLINKWNGTGLYSGLRMINPNNMTNRVRWRVNSSAFVEGTTNVPIGQWHHVVCTYNGAQLRVYQNGVLTGTLNHSGPIATTGNELQLGRQANGTPNGGITYRGDWDQVRIYNRALSVEEIQVLFNNESIIFSNAQFCDEEEDLSLSTYNFEGAEYAWTGPNGFTSNEQNPEPIPNADSELNAGVYTLQVTVDGCSSEVWSSDLVIHPFPQAPTTENMSVCGSGNAILTASGAPLNGSYRWYTTEIGGSPIGGQSGPTLTVNNVTQTTSYWVSVIANGCESERTEVIAIYFSDLNTALEVSGSATCTTDLEAAVVVQNAESFVEYQAFLNDTPVSEPVTGSGDLSIPIPLENLELGNNAIVIQATQPGCGMLPLDNQVNLNVIAAQPASITALSAPDFCEGQTVQLMATEGESYLWSNGATTNTIAVSTSGQWSVVVTDANGCTSTTPAFITVANQVPTPEISAAAAFICPNTTVQLTATGGTTYLWSTGGQGASLEADEAGNYSVTVSNGGCSVESEPFALVAGLVPNLVVETSNTEVCEGETVTLTASGADSYVWSNNVQNGVPFTLAQSATFIVTGSLSNGCSSSDQVTVTVNQLPNAAFTPSALALCGPADVVSLSANETGQATYNWTLNGDVINAQNASSISVTAGGFYTLTVISSNGCSASQSFELSEGEVPMVSTFADVNSICAGEVAFLSASTAAGNGVQWFLNGNVAPGNSNGLLYEASLAGSYAVEVTSADGCSVLSDAILIVVLDAPQLELSAQATALCDGESTLLTATVEESGDFIWSFDGITIVNATEASYMADAAGVYEVTFIANACSSSAQITIEPGDLPAAASPIVGNPSEVCAGESFTLSVSNQADASEYHWFILPESAASIGAGQGTNAVVINPMNTNFTVGVTPLNSCGEGPSSSTSITVTDEFFCFGQVMFAADETVICTGTQVTFSNYTDPQVFFGLNPLWNFGQGASPATSTSSGLVTVTYSTPGPKTVTLSYIDFFGEVFEQEVKTDYVNVTNGPMTSAISGPTELPCDLGTGVYTVASNAGSTFEWSLPLGAEIISGQGTNEITVNFNGAFGTLSVTETSAIGCEGASVSLTVDCVVGIASNDRDALVRLYPNPANALVNLEVDAMWQGAEWKLIDLSGRQVMQGTVTARLTTLDLAHCANGTYILQLVGLNRHQALRLTVAR